MAFQTGRIQIDGSLNVDGSIYQFNELFTPGGTGGGGDVAWASGNVGSNNQLITANGDGSIVAESKLTFDGNRLDIDASLRVGLAGDYWLEVNVANGGFPVTKIGDLGETGNGGWLEIDGGWGDITWWAELTDARWGWEFATEALWTNVNNDVSVGKDLRVGKVTTLDGSVFFRGIIEVSTGYTLYYNPTTDEVTYDEVSPGGGGGITWSGSTANGIATYGSSSTVVSEPNLTFDGIILEFGDGAASRTIKMGDAIGTDPASTLNIFGAKGSGSAALKTATLTGGPPGHYYYYIYPGLEGGDILLQGGAGADVTPTTSQPQYPYNAFNGGDGGDLLLYAGDPGVGWDKAVPPTQGAVTIKGETITLNSEVVDVAHYIRHIGDPDTFVSFAANTISFYAGGVTNDKMFVNSTGIVVNEDAQNYDFRIESANKTSAFWVDANLDQIIVEARILADNSVGTTTKNDPRARITAVGDNCVISSTSIDLRTEFAFDATHQTPSNNQGTGIKFCVGNGNQYPGTAAIVANRLGTYSAGELLFGVKTTVGASDSSMSVFHSLDGFNQRARWYNATGVEEVRFNLTNGQIDANGDVVAYSTLVSDIRLKENIIPLENSLDKILQLQGISYDRKSNGENHLGYIAQEVEKIIPYVVVEKTLPLETGDEDTLYKTIRYQEIIPIITEAMKEQQDIIKDQEKRIKDLEEKVGFLMKQLN